MIDLLRIEKFGLCRDENMLEKIFESRSENQIKTNHAFGLNILYLLFSEIMQMESQISKFKHHNDDREGAQIILWRINLIMQIHLCFLQNESVREIF